jgi:hypothetical protein
MSPKQQSLFRSYDPRAAFPPSAMGNCRLLDPQGYAERDRCKKARKRGRGRPVPMFSDLGS